jgi:serine/threonine protein kinase
MPILQEGQQLGAYRIEDLVGRGGMAEVYRALHLTLERSVAIKVLIHALNADPTFMLRFLREARAVARLTHPNIIAVYDFGEEGETAYLVMQLATGGTLRDQARRFQTLGEIVEGLAPVAAALQYAHEHGVVHRDVKPINVLIDEAERPLLADFGLARILTDSLDLSSPGLVLGSPHYLAPEQAMGEEVDQRADIYAFGIIVYELIVGRLPFTGATPLAVIEQQISTPPPSIRGLLPGLPPTLDATIQRALAKRPADRFASVADLMSELRTAAHQAPDLQIGRHAAEAAQRTPPSAQLNTPSASTPAAGGAASSTPHAPESIESAPAGAESAVVQQEAGDATTFLPRPSRPARSVYLSAAAGEPAAKRRRATSFNQGQWLVLGTTLLIVVFINAVGLWLALAGSATANGDFAAGVVTYIYSNLGWFKSVLTSLALILALLAVIAMRAVVVQDAQRSRETNRLLRQYHRFVGYLAILIAFAVGLLTCLGIFGFRVSTPRDALHSTLGAALLILIVVKIAVVRFIPSQRRHLRLLGESLFVLFLLVFATSTVPFLWGQVTGDGGSSPYPGQSVSQPAPRTDIGAPKYR